MWVHTKDICKDYDKFILQCIRIVCLFEEKDERKDRAIIKVTLNIWIQKQ